MADDEGWTVAGNSRNRRKGKSTKAPTVSVTQRLKTLEQEDNDFNSLTNAQQEKRALSTFLQIFPKIIEIVSNNFALETVERILVTHPAFLHLSVEDSCSRVSTDGPLVLKCSTLAECKETWKDVLIRNFLHHHSITKKHESGLSDSLKSYPMSSATCLGIGSISSSIPQAQLAIFLLLVSLYLPGDLFQSVLLYDPVFLSIDIFMIEKILGFSVPRENIEGKIRLESISSLTDTPTLQFPIRSTCHFVYLPHCGVGLSSNILWANWDSHVGNVLLLANSIDRSLSILKMGASSGGKIVSAPEVEQLLPFCKPIVDAFASQFGECTKKVSSLEKTIDSSFLSSLLFPGDCVGVKHGDETAEENNIHVASNSHTSHNWVTLVRLAPFLSEIDLSFPKDLANPHAFNDTSFQWVSLSSDTHGFKKNLLDYQPSINLRQGISLDVSQFNLLLSLRPPEYRPEFQNIQMIDGKPVGLSVDGVVQQGSGSRKVPIVLSQNDPEIITRLQKN